MTTVARSIAIEAADVVLQGDLAMPATARGVVLFAHGSGSSRSSPRNRAVAAALNAAGFATLLFDLLSLEEEAEDRRTARLRFDIGLLAGRLLAGTDWILADGTLGRLPLGYFGASTGAAAALIAAAARPSAVAAVVSRGGRPDLAGPSLTDVRAPTLLIVGGRDTPVIALNREALGRLPVAELEIVPGATHLFEEPGALQTVAELAAAWFTRHLLKRRAA